MCVRLFTPDAVAYARWNIIFARHNGVLFQCVFV